VQVTVFDTNDASFGLVPDHTNDHVTIGQTGLYKIFISAALESVGSGSQNFQISAFKNNLTTEFSNVHSDRDVSGSGGEVAYMGGIGNVFLTAGDTVEVGVANTSATSNIIVKDCTLTVDIKAGNTS
jgi:hypothetical protein